MPGTGKVSRELPGGVKGGSHLAHTQKNNGQTNEQTYKQHTNITSNVTLNAEPPTEQHINNNNSVCAKECWWTVVVVDKKDQQAALFYPKCELAQDTQIPTPVEIQAAYWIS